MASFEFLAAALTLEFSLLEPVASLFGPSRFEQGFQSPPMDKPNPVSSVPCSFSAGSTDPVPRLLAICRWPASYCIEEKRPSGTKSTTSLSLLIHLHCHHCANILRSVLPPVHGELDHLCSGSCLLCPLLRLSFLKNSLFLRPSIRPAPLALYP